VFPQPSELFSGSGRRRGITENITSKQTLKEEGIGSIEQVQNTENNKRFLTLNRLLFSPLYLSLNSLF
jgi:hypothetical protein